MGVKELIHKPLKAEELKALVKGPAGPDEKPPVETVALWSPRDGIVHPRSACGRPGERDRSVALRCSHMGFTLPPEAVEAVLGELDSD